MNAADVVGYAMHGALYCPEHVPEPDGRGYGPNPVFASDSQEGDACDVEGCGYLEGCEPEEMES